MACSKLLPAQTVTLVLPAHVIKLCVLYSNACHASVVLGKILSSRKFHQSATSCVVVSEISTKTLREKSPSQNGLTMQGR